MKILRFAVSYLRQYRKLITILGLFAIIFGAVFSLYRLEAEAVWYASLLCAAVGLITLGIDFVLQYGKHRRLTALIGKHLIDTRDLPVPLKSLERDYTALVEFLLEDKQKLLNKHNRNRYDMEAYYTLWVHQIKSPIAAMRLLLQSEDSAQNTELSLALFKIEQYVEMVLSYLRLGSETTDFVIKVYPLNEIVKGAVRKYAPLFVRKKLALDLMDIDCEVLTDEKWLAFVVEQVLSNALKYTVAGKITIYTEGKTLFIEDSGMGIAAEDLPRIGEKGFTGLNGRFDKKATGIGLFLCRTICQKLGHPFAITSRVGKGTKVAITFENIQRVVE